MEGEYEEAYKSILTVMQVMGYQPDLLYNIALCYYSMKQCAPALKCIADIREHEIREQSHIVLTSVGMTTEGIAVRSVGYQLKISVDDPAQEALTDRPPCSEEGLDPATLQNQALTNMHSKPTEVFEKLLFLLQQNPFPAETFGNLLLLYIKKLITYFSKSEDPYPKASNRSTNGKYINGYTANRQAFQKFETAAKLTEQLCKLTKQVEHHWDDDDAVKRAANEYDEALELGHCNNQECPCKRRKPHAIVLANPCIFYIMTSQTEEVSKAISGILSGPVNVRSSLISQWYYYIIEILIHLTFISIICINVNSGLVTVLQLNFPLGTDTWYYTKRRFLSLLENMSKHMIMLQDCVLQELIIFLLRVKNVPAVIEQPLEEYRMHTGKSTVTYESRLLKALIYEIISWNQ
ncbi:TT30A protein, partial [Polyodon spathula]|nr:TT30A protein [Polyodon spathula]